MWVGDPGAACHMTNNAELMYDMRPPPSNRSRIVLGDGSSIKVECIGNIELLFHSYTEYPSTPYSVSFVPVWNFIFF